MWRKHLEQKLLKLRTNRRGAFEKVLHGLIIKHELSIFREIAAIEEPRLVVAGMLLDALMLIINLDQLFGAANPNRLANVGLRHAENFFLELHELIGMNFGLFPSGHLEVRCRQRQEFITFQILKNF